MSSIYVIDRQGFVISTERSMSDEISQKDEIPPRTSVGMT